MIPALKCRVRFAATRHQLRLLLLLLQDRVLNLKMQSPRLPYRTVHSPLDTNILAFGPRSGYTQPQFAYRKFSISVSK